MQRQYRRQWKYLGTRSNNDKLITYQTYDCHHIPGKKNKNAFTEVTEVEETYNYEVSKLQMPGKTGSLASNTLHETSITTEDWDIRVESGRNTIGVG